MKIDLSQFNPSCAGVRKNHVFCFGTKLSKAEMVEIDEWIEGLSKKEKRFLDLLLEDTQLEIELNRSFIEYNQSFISESEDA